MVIVIAINGVDLTQSVMLAQAEFTSAANGAAGTCTFRLRNLLHDITITTGNSITLDIDGVHEWTGFVQQVKRGYFFDVEDTNCNCHSVPVYLEIRGADLNLLLQRRFLYDKVTPTKIDLTNFPAGSSDQSIIEYYAANHLDLSGDGLDTTTLVQSVGSPSRDDVIYGRAGDSWDAFLRFINFNIGAIYYIDPDHRLVWADVETETAPFEISDTPSGTQVGYRNFELLDNGSELINDAMIWGAGQGSQFPVFSRVQDAASIALHGRWQVGQALLPIFKQATADRTASTYVYGSPQNQRGHKDDAIGIKATVFRSGLRVAQKIRTLCTIFGVDITLPIRTCRITFPTNDQAQWDLGISSLYDTPWTGFDFFPFVIAPIPPIVFDSLPPFPPFNPCLPGPTANPPVTRVFDSFDRTTGGNLGTASSGAVWRRITTDSDPRLGCNGFVYFLQYVAGVSPPAGQDAFQIADASAAPWGGASTLVLRSQFRWISVGTGIAQTVQIDLDFQEQVRLQVSTTPGNGWIRLRGDNSTLFDYTDWKPGVWYRIEVTRGLFNWNQSRLDVWEDNVGILTRVMVDTAPPFGTTSNTLSLAETGVTNRAEVDFIEFDTDVCPPATQPTGDPPTGRTCLNLYPIDTPYGQNSAYKYFCASNAYPGPSFDPGSSEVWFDGLFLRSGQDYTEDWANGTIVVTNNALFVASGPQPGPDPGTHVCYMCGNFSQLVAV